MNTRYLSFYLIVLLLGSFIFATTQGASQSFIESEKPEYNSDVPGTHVTWEKTQETEVDSWDWRSLAWEFGPYPSYAIHLENGTEITDANFIPVGENFTVLINVQKDLFTDNKTLGGASINWHLDLLNQTHPEDYLGWANIRMEYTHAYETNAEKDHPEWEREAFHIWSEIWNRTEQTVDDLSILKSSPQEETPVTLFLNVSLTETNLWNEQTSPQSLPVESSTTSQPGVTVGNTAIYDLTVTVDPYDPSFPYDGPQNGTIEVEVTEINGNNVTFTTSFIEDGVIESSWIDITTGKTSAEDEVHALIASNLTDGDKIYNELPYHITNTFLQTLLSTERLINEYYSPEIRYRWDRSTGLLVSMQRTETMYMPLDPSPEPYHEPPQQQIFLWDSTNSYVTETETAWQIQIAGQFNASMTPMGPYHVNLEVYNSQHDHIDFGYMAWESQNSPYRMIAVGQPGFGSNRYNEAWTFQKVDLNNQTVHSVARGSPWIMRVNVTSSQLANVTLGLHLDDNIRTYVNVTGWYDKTVEEVGGWQYNQSSDSYYWNASAIITRAEQVYGPHLEERWTWVPHQHTINVTDSYWNEDTGQMELHTRTEEIWGENLYLVYDHNTANFSIMQGYRYWSYDPLKGYHRDINVLRPVNTSDPTTQFYYLDLDQSRATQTGLNQWTIDFVGAFNASTVMDNPDNIYWLEQPCVYRTDGEQIWADWETMNWNELSVAVDRMVAVTTFYKNGRKITDWMLPIDQGDTIQLQCQLQGALQLYDDIDAISVRFHADNGHWEPNENIWSNTEIQLIYEPSSGQLTSETYNRTEKSVYVEGTYWDWQEINVTDFHYIYAPSSGTWEWVNETYTQWNWTQIQGYHWEHWILNQTEYARDPLSPDLWIDQTHTWIPDHDPALRVPDSYAYLQDAAIILEEDTISVSLNITFAETAPDTRFWWDLYLSNYTYGQDYSQGHGEHTLTEWTKSDIYSLQSPETGDEKWYLEPPTQPYYTILNNTKYRVIENPYLILGDDRFTGSKVYINSRTTYDSWSQNEHTEYLLRDPWDPQLETEPRYFELINGTKLYVHQLQRIFLRELTLNVSDAYTRNSDGSKHYLPHGTAITTLMPYAQWEPEYYDSSQGYWIYPQSYQLLDGSLIYRDESFEYEYWNSTTNRHELYNTVYTEEITTQIVEYGGHCVMLNNTMKINLRNDGAWWQSDPTGTGYYLIMTNGTRIFHPDPWSVHDDSQRHVMINGKNYIISWPTEYYIGQYNGETIYAHNDRGQVYDYYYTVVNDHHYELPYPNALATSWWDLENLQSEGGRLLTGKSILLNDQQYPIFHDESLYYILDQETPVTVTKPTIDLSHYYSRLNGQDVWNITQSGWSASYGHYQEQTGQLTEIEGTIHTITGYNPQEHQWQEWNKYGEDYENKTKYLVNAIDASRINVYTGRYVTIWPVTIDSTTYYTFDRYDQSEPVLENGETIWKSYIQTLEGTKVYFDWGTNPASWGTEIKVDVPGMNYTRLIPYHWDVRYFKDRTHIYNITIIENTSMYFANHSQVPIDTTFKVWGTPQGPGIRVWTSEDGSSPRIEGLPAEWLDIQWMHYLETIDGQKIYSSHPYPFGYDFNIQAYNPGVIQQWTLNTDQTTGNKSVSVVEGDYYFKLQSNSTGRDLTLFTAMSWWQHEYYPDEMFIILLNGTRLDFEYAGEGYVGDEYCYERYSIILDEQLHYVVGGNRLEQYYKVLDANELYPLYDSGYIVASPYNVPVIDNPSMTSLWMNTTSNHVLINTALNIDELGYYYLHNQSSGETLSLEAVGHWWPYSSEVLNDLFQYYWELEGTTPRYNVTLNGVEYFVLDPAPSKEHWWSDFDDDSRYDSTFTFNGTTYPIHWHDWEQCAWRRYDGVLIDGVRWELEDSWRWTPVYSIPLTGGETKINITKENIYQTHTTWGPAYGWILTDLELYALRTVNDIIVGNPDYDMWGVNAFEVVPDSGALDLDGDLATTDDQYFVRRHHVGSDTWNHTTDRMEVNIYWDPNSDVSGDEIHIDSWMGKVHTTWAFVWNETYVWYYAANMSVINAATLETITTTVQNNVTGKPNPGYWEIERMVQNSTWEDLRARALREGWDWFGADNTHEFEWLWFGTHQDYQTDYTSGNYLSSANVGFTYEYAGLLLYNDTNIDTIMQPQETTHFFMPDQVGTIGFTTPGEAYDITDDYGVIRLGLTDSIEYGVSFTNVNGTLFPYDDTQPQDMWGWWDGMVYGADFHVPNVNYKPTTTEVDDMSFMVHFNASVNDNALNNEARLKIDEYYGSWQVDPNAIDGRQKLLPGNVSAYLQGNEILTDRSLAASWYVTASNNVGWQIQDQMGSEVSTDNVTSSESYDLVSQDATFASIYMGGIYEWQKPTSINDTIRTFNVTSYTTPMGTFHDSYVSESGKSSSGFDITTSMYFLTVGFPNWDGYGVYHDPQTAAYISQLGSSLPMEGDGLPINYMIYIFLALGVVAIVGTIIFVQKRNKGVFPSFFLRS